jgi:hypothetical protein
MAAAGVATTPPSSRTVGAGHSHQLEVPEQVNAMIARFLQLIG